jgi:hypothetical protein
MCICSVSLYSYKQIHSIKGSLEVLRTISQRNLANNISGALRISWGKNSLLKPLLLLFTKGYIFVTEALHSKKISPSGTLSQDHHPDDEPDSAASFPGLKEQG